MRERIVSKVGVFKIHADVADYRLSIFKFSTFLFLFFYFVYNIYKIRNFVIQSRYLIFLISKNVYILNLENYV